jgi:acetyl-CoA carboxylase carboxyl transferase subunit beta
MLLDDEGRREIGAEVKPVDILKFKDGKRYPDRLARRKAAPAKTTRWW